ncbi:tryptophanase [Candidatus Scalindua japonica]|uniref:Tryptophanase n=1 Tax=Candidatus Scalindua japonica TaxID=1284222 RepID=A0A286U2D4_9BACT|nr:tryptophanase [Candidatus Scalindua japonica]
MILAKVLVKPGMVIPNNLLFISTSYHQTLAGAELIEIPVVEAYDLISDSPFKGNIDTKQLEVVIRKYGKEKIPYVLIETAVNASGGHPVSMENIKNAYNITKEHNIPLILDACRLLDNACLIRQREQGYSHKSLKEIVMEFCSYTDGCVMSASKNYYIDTGGFIATNIEQLFNQFMDVVMVYGDGLSVRAKGKLNTAIKYPFKNERIINDRVNITSYLWKKLEEAGVPVVRPAAACAVFIDTYQLSEYIAPDQFPEKSFLVHLYLKSGILGSENLITTGQGRKGIRMVRFALPLRSYKIRHMNYVAKHIIQAWKERKQIKGLKKTYAAPCQSGQFMAQYQIIE